MSHFRETRHLKIRRNEQSTRGRAGAVIGRTTGEPKKCRLCGRVVRLLVNQTYGNAREHRKHKCPHGQDCPTGMKGLIAQTLTPRCGECRIEYNKRNGPFDPPPNLPRMFA